MKKFISIFVITIFILFFNKAILSKIISFSASKWTEKDVSIKNIEINYSKRQIILNDVEVKNIDNFHYKNIFEADKIKIRYNFKSLFTNLIIIDNLFFLNSKFFLEFDINENVIINDNLEEVKKYNIDYKSKIYPIKKRDINFLILETATNNSHVFIKTSNKPIGIQVNLSDMNFKKVGNKKEFQHYKQIFKLILGDLFFKIRDKNLRKLIKKTYKF